MTGGGANVEPDTMNLLTTSYPETSTKWTAASRAHEIPANATITAYAIGVKPKAGSIYAAFPRVERKCGVRSSNNPHSNIVTLSVGFGQGYVVLGGGGKLNRDQTNDSYNYLTATYPVDASSWRVSGKDHRIPSSTVLTICALGAKGIEMMN